MNSQSGCGLNTWEQQLIWVCWFSCVPVRSLVAGHWLWMWCFRCQTDSFNQQTAGRSGPCIPEAHLKWHYHCSQVRDPNTAPPLLSHPALNMASEPQTRTWQHVECQRSEWAKNVDVIPRNICRSDLWPHSGCYSDADGKADEDEAALLRGVC